MIIRTLGRHSSIGNPICLRIIYSSFASVIKFTLLALLISFAFSFSNFEFIDKYTIDSNFIYISLSVFFTVMILLISSCYQGLGKSVTGSFFQNVLTPLMFCVSTTFFYKYIDDGSYSFYFKLYTLCIFIVFIVSLFFIYPEIRRLHVVREKFKIAERMSFLNLTYVASLQQCMQWSSHFICAYYLMSFELAIFSASQRTATLITISLIAINLVYSPRFSKAYHEDDFNRLLDLFNNARLTMILVALPFFISIFMFSDNVMGLFGDDYSLGSNVLIIMAIGQLIKVFFGPVLMLLNMTGHEKDLKEVLIFCTILGVVFSVILTSFFGLVGGAISVSISVVLQNILAANKVKKRLGIDAFSFKLAGLR